MGFVMRMGAFSAIALGFPVIPAPFSAITHGFSAVRILFSAIATTLREIKKQLLYEMFFNNSCFFNYSI